jgi:hypothetical protein
VWIGGRAGGLPPAPPLKLFYIFILGFIHKTEHNSIEKF